MRETVLVVDDDPGHLTTLKTLVGSWGYQVETADDGAAAVARVKQGPVDLILMDVRMARMSGIDALKEIKAYNPAIPIIIMTAYSSVSSAVEALKAGAYDYLIKPLDFDALQLSIARAREHAGLKMENRQLKAKLGAGFHAENIIGRSPSMKAMLDMLAMIAPAEATVLIAGESGTGKEQIGRNGRWVETQEYGYVWTPTIDISADWAPYRHGRWVWIGGDYVWIASEPWGWAPYHYGRWSHISSHGWCWVPPPRHEVYWGPGYVSWVSTNTDVAWVPLAPGEIYYGHGHYGPHSVNIVDADISAVIPGRNYRNVHVRNAVSVVHRDAFLRGQYRNMGHRENPFLRERINIGRPRLEPERATMMPIVRDIPREHLHEPAQHPA